MSDAKNKSVTITKTIRHPLFEISKRSDELIRATTSDTAWITLKEAKEFLAALSAVTQNKPHLILYIPGRHMSINKEARSFMASEAGMRDVIALAVVVKSIVHRIIGNLFVTVDRPLKPVHHFSEESEAIAWLKSHNQ